MKKIGYSIERKAGMNPTQNSSLEVVQGAQCSGAMNLICRDLEMKKWSDLIVKVMNPSLILLPMSPCSCYTNLQLWSVSVYASKIKWPPKKEKKKKLDQENLSEACEWD